MVVGAFPVAKLGALLIRQLSKPLANYVKNRAKNHPFFRKYVCMPPAQFYNWCEIKAKMWMMNLGKPVNIPPLNEAMAIELGANLLGEGILFLTAATIILLEWGRRDAKQVTKEQQQEEDLKMLKSTVQELTILTERQEAQLRELFRHISDLDARVVKVPWTSQKVESELDEVNVTAVLETKQDALTRAISYVQNDLLFVQRKRNMQKVG